MQVNGHLDGHLYNYIQQVCSDTQNLNHQYTVVFRGSTHGLAYPAYTLDTIHVHKCEWVWLSTYQITHAERILNLTLSFTF